MRLTSSSRSEATAEKATARAIVVRTAKRFHMFLPPQTQLRTVLCQMKCVCGFYGAVWKVAKIGFMFWLSQIPTVVFPEDRLEPMLQCQLTSRGHFQQYNDPFK